MDKFDRIFKLHAILDRRRTGISLKDLADKLECSKATVYRAIATLKDTLQAPIVLSRDSGGYRYDTTHAERRYELPGLWFAPAELQALVIIQRFLNDLGGGLLEEHFAPLTKRINELMTHKRLNLSEVATRLRLPTLAARPTGPAFEGVVGATLQRRKIWIEYRARTTDETTERTISPQRVIHYRECWYLDAWDEGKNDLRTFAIDRIRKLREAAGRAKDVPEATLDEHFRSSYGIFSGKADKIAVLCFSQESARWVAEEKWHSQQQGRFLEDGRYELKIPYAHSRELVMDLLRHGPNVEVLEPKDLRDEVRNQLGQALARYAE